MAMPTTPASGEIADSPRLPVNGAARTALFGSASRYSKYRPGPSSTAKTTVVARPARNVRPNDVRRRRSSQARYGPIAGLKAMAHVTPSAPLPAQPGSASDRAAAAAKNSMTFPSATSWMAGEDVTAATATAAATGHPAPQRRARRATAPARATSLTIANDSAVSPVDQTAARGGG